MKNMLATLLVLVSINCEAMEFEFRNVCSLKAQSDVALSVSISEGRSICKIGTCFAGIYKAEVMGRNFENNSTNNLKAIEFTTTAPIIVGETYLLFANKILPENRRLYVETYDGAMELQLPKTVEYFVPFDAAFLQNQKGYSRRVARGCSGNGNDCRTINTTDVKGMIAADVLYAGFIDEVKSCR